MTSFDLFSLRKVFADQGVMICFNGPFSHSVIEELGIAVRKYLQSDDAPKDRIADVFSVFVEQAQNLKYYTGQDFSDLPGAADFRNGTLVIARDEEHYIVSSGNLVRRQDAEVLLSELEQISKLDHDELRALYKRRLRGDASSAHGAGLGLVEMARKASRPILYKVQDIGDGSRYFSISVFI